MLKNYVLLAIKVLGRNKFYTCVSLFSISITLMVLVLVTSLVDSFVNPRGPERNSEHILVGAYMSIQQTTADGNKLGSVGALGYRFIGGPPERLATHLKTEIAKWEELAKKGSFK